MLQQFWQGIRPVFLYLSDHRFRMVRFEMVWTLLVMVTCFAVQLIHSQPLADPIVSAAPAAGQVKAAATVATAASESPQAEVAVPPAAAVVATPPCVPSASYTSRPPAISLGNHAEGLTIMKSTSYYQVYGASRSEVIAQMMQCGASREYAGEAGYTINWSYALRADESGACRVVGVRVGVRTSLLLPEGHVGPAIAGAWQAMINGLSAHEQGHVALAEQYGARMLEGLQNYPAGDCYTMGPSVEATAQGIAAQLRSAQANYDSATGHGASQGAVF